MLTVPAYGDQFIVDTGNGNLDSTNGGFVVDGSDQITVAEGTTLAVSGDANNALVADGNDNDIINLGTVRASGKNSHAFVVTGDGNTLINHGTVTVAGVPALHDGSALIATGNDNVTINHSTIETTGWFGYGMSNIGSDGVQENIGTIRTVGRTAYSMYNVGDGGTQNNSGDLFSASAGMLLEGDTGEQNNSGNITSGGSSGHGMRITGNDGVQRNSGDITVGPGAAAHAMSHQGSGGYQENTGTINSAQLGMSHSGSGGTQINTSDIFATDGGMYQFDGGGTQFNSGTIETTGEFARGLYISGSDAVQENVGNIKTTGLEAHGVYSVGSDGRQTNSGHVEASGQEARGLFIDGFGGVQTNFGTIVTGGRRSYAILHEGDGGTQSNFGDLTSASGGLFHIGSNGIQTNAGNISTRNANSHGLHISGDSGVQINDGSIDIGPGSDAHGMNHGGDGGFQLNTGTITTTSMRTRAMSHGGDGGTQINSGDILSTTGGVFHFGDDGTQINSGNIETTDAFGHGLFIRGSGGVQTNTGTIITGDRGAFGILQWNFGTEDSGTIENSGLIHAQDPDASAIGIQGTGGTINLNLGSVIIGEIEFLETLGSASLAAETATLNFGTGLSASVEFVGGNAGTITTKSGAIFVDDNVVHHVDATSFAAMDQFALTTTQALTNAVEDRAAFAHSKDENNNSVWGQFIGGSFSSDPSDTVGGYDGQHIGVIFGTDISPDQGWFAGFQTGRVAADYDDAFETSQAGVTVGYYLERGNLTYQISVGLAYNDSDRETAGLAGLEDASSKYWSATVNPAISYQGLLGSTNTIRLRYTGAFIQAHKFDFVTTPTLRVGDRLTHIVEARLGFSQPIGRGKIRYGIDAIYSESTDGTFGMLGDEVRLDSGQNGFIQRGYLGYEIASKFGMGRVEVGVTDSDKVSFSGALTFRF